MLKTAWWSRAEAKQISVWAALIKQVHSWLKSGSRVKRRKRQKVNRNFTGVWSRLAGLIKVESLMHATLHGLLWEEIKNWWEQEKRGESEGINRIELRVGCQSCLITLRRRGRAAVPQDDWIQSLQSSCPQTVADHVCLLPITALQLGHEAYLARHWRGHL